MSETPIDIVINGLQTQISELKEIISGLNNDQNTSCTTSTAQMKSIKDECDSLKIENAKCNYRITHLLRALDKKDYEISLLKKDLNKTEFK
ncbi:hypothetical protein C1645_817625 [Glomus cerebriforme]|uniref:Uncharacterized protein n=1 Tax=Glomus cerebriforme TaxID=658196 RepID=A0A397T900_9GLOM|nr:hypothetical protein C1645_817625 [Glomus cerebriforme]